MWSKDTLPVESSCTGRSRLVEELVAPDGVRGEVLGQDTAEELAGPLGAADHAGALAVGEDRRVPGVVAAHRADAVQREAAAEQLQVARAQLEPADQVLAVAG